MIRDRLTTLAKNTALNTGGAGSYIIGDAIDLQTTSRNIGSGSDGLWFYAVVNVTATSGGSATLVLNLITDDNSSFSSPTVIASSGTAIAVANLVKGKVIVAVKVPSVLCERYVGIQQTTGTAAFTAGSIDAFFAEDIPDWLAVPDAL